LLSIPAETRGLLAASAPIDAMLRDGTHSAAAIADPIVAEAEWLVGVLRP
jgi:tryptophanyl-tRNA synthetase